MLPTDERLKSNRDFQQIYSAGRSYPGAYVVLYALAIPEPELKIGFSVSKKLGNAVVRNKTKRRLREICHMFIDQIPRGHRLIFVARKRAATAEFQQLVESVKNALTSAKLLQ